MTPQPPIHYHSERSTAGKLPWVQWDLPEAERGTARLLCIAEAVTPFVSGWIVVDLLRSQIDVDEWVGVRSVRTSRFAAPRRPDLTLIKTEVVLEITCREGKEHLERVLPRLVSLIGMAPGLEDYRRYLSAVTHFHPVEKARELWQLCATVHRRWPKKVGVELIDNLHQFLAVTSSDFREARTARHMARLVVTAHLFGRQLGWKNAVSPDMRHLRVRLFPAVLTFPFGQKRVTAIVVNLNLDRELERFGLSHLMRAITAVLPEVTVVADSYVSHQRTYYSIRIVYVEIQHQDGRPLHRHEMVTLKRELPRECREHVEQLTNAVFAYRNDEEVYRSILTLRRELQYVRDLPQVILFFDGQDQQDLVFGVTLVRILKAGSVPIQQLLSRAPKAVVCLVDEVMIVGHLRKKHPKEASVFRLKFPKKPFLRKNYSLDLRRARLFVGNVLSNALGEVRDYNGGLIMKQNEVLDAARGLLRPNERKQEHLLESLFDGLVPKSMQSYLPPSILAILYRLLLESLNVSTSGRAGYQVVSREVDGWVIMMVRVDGESCREPLQAAVDRLALDNFDLATTWLNVHGIWCLGYVYNGRNPQEGQRLQAAVQEAMAQWSARRMQRQCLRLNFAPGRTALDPRLRTTRRAGTLMKMLYEGLMRLGRDDRAELALARSVNISADGRRYTFLLRDSVWSNGTPLVAEDFAYSWRQLLSPKVHSQHSFLLYPILGARAAKEGRVSVDCVGIRVIDSHTLVVDLEHPTSYFLDLTAHWVFSPLCQEIDQTFPEWARATGDGYVCNGPFRLASAQVSGRIRLLRNERYWDSGAVQLEQIDVHTIEEPEIALRRFEEDTIDWLGDPVADLPHRSLKRLEVQGSLKTAPSSALFWLMVNTRKPPFTSAKVRRALAICIDRRQLVSAVLSCGEVPATSILPPELSLLDQPLFQDGCVEEARRLWAEGLEELGCCADALAPIIVGHGEQEGHDLVAAEVARQWHEGLRIAAYPENMSCSQDRLRPDYDVAGLIWYCYSNAPMFNLRHMRDRHICLNATGWEHPEYRRLLDQADRCLEVKRRNKLLKQAEALVMEHMPLIPLYRHRHRFVSRPGVNGVLTSSLGYIDLKWTFIE